MLWLTNGRVAWSMTGCIATMYWDGRYKPPMGWRVLRGPLDGHWKPGEHGEMRQEPVAAPS